MVTRFSRSCSPLLTRGRLDGLHDVHRVKGDIARRVDIERAFTLPVRSGSSISRRTAPIPFRPTPSRWRRATSLAWQRCWLLPSATAAQYDQYRYVVRVRRCNHAPSEEEPPCPNSDYASTKAAATWLCHRARTRGVPVTTLRLYSAYGPFEEERRLIPTLVRAALAGKLPPLASPTVVRDSCMSSDVIDAYIAAARSPNLSTIYNVASGVQTSLAELVARTIDIFSIASKPEWGGTRIAPGIPGCGSASRRSSSPSRMEGHDHPR